MSYILLFRNMITWFIWLILYMYFKWLRKGLRRATYMPPATTERGMAYGELERKF
jgi:hypothetical protein